MALVSGGGSGGGGSLVTIFSKTLTSPQATFDTNTILGGVLPTNHTTLQLVIVGAESGAETNGPVVMTFNGDTTSGHYFWAQVNVASTSSPSGSGGGSDSGLTIANIPGSTATPANTVGIGVAFIPNYTASTFVKSYNGNYSFTRNTTATNQFTATVGGIWNSTAAITRIVLTPNSGNFVTGTMFTLYGLN